MKNDAINLQLCYAVTYELVGLYMTVSDKHITPGLSKLSDLRLGTEEASSKTEKNNETWT